MRSVLNTGRGRLARVGRAAHEYVELVTVLPPRHVHTHSLV